MPHQVIRDANGREVVRLVTDGGVVAYVATCVSPELLAAMAAKLRTKLTKSQASVKDPKLQAAIARLLSGPHSDN